MTDDTARKTAEKRRLREMQKRGWRYVKPGWLPPDVADQIEALIAQAEEPREERQSETAGENQDER